MNSDFSQRVVVDSTALPWTESPQAGVYRQLLERDGAEVARATSIVRYAAKTRFSGHAHAFGEEMFVLSGDFFDETGHYATGTYLKNPPESTHAPGSVNGCTLFVKLRHLDARDAERCVVDSQHATWFDGMADGLRVLPLATFQTQHTALVRWAPGTEFSRHRHAGGEEIFVLDGVFNDEHGHYPAGTWLRNPHGSEHRPFSTQGCTILVKIGHLHPGPQTTNCTGRP